MSRYQSMVTISSGPMENRIAGPLTGSGRSCVGHAHLADRVWLRSKREC
jgi:hypothetical protein